MISVVNGRSVTDIKRGLICCDVTHSCYECPYNPPGAAECEMTSAIDALAYIGALEHELDKLQKAYESAQPKWISITERMPDTGESVICYANGYIPRVVTGWHDAQHKMWHLDCDINRIITHWMPLPKPPKEET